MPATAAQLAPTQFNSQTAVAAAKASHVARRELWEDHKQMLKLLRDASTAPLTVVRQIRLTVEQIKHTRRRLNDTKACYCERCERGGIGDKERASLLRELVNLMDHELRLHGIGPPARVKSTSEPGSRRPVQQIVARVMPEATPLASDVSSPTQEPKPQG